MGVHPRSAPLGWPPGRSADEGRAGHCHPGDGRRRPHARGEERHATAGARHHAGCGTDAVCGAAARRRGRGARHRAGGAPARSRQRVRMRPERSRRRSVRLRGDGAGRGARRRAPHRQACRRRRTGRGRLDARCPRTAACRPELRGDRRPRRGTSDVAGPGPWHARVLAAVLEGPRPLVERPGGRPHGNGTSLPRRDASERAPRLPASRARWLPQHQPRVAAGRGSASAADREHPEPRGRAPVLRRRTAPPCGVPSPRTTASRPIPPPVSGWSTAVQSPAASTSGSWRPSRASTAARSWCAGEAGPRGWRRHCARSIREKRTRGAWPARTRRTVPPLAGHARGAGAAPAAVVEREAGRVRRLGPPDEARSAARRRSACRRPRCALRAWFRRRWCRNRPVDT